MENDGYVLYLEDSGEGPEDAERNQYVFLYDLNLDRFIGYYEVPGSTSGGNLTTINQARPGSIEKFGDIIDIVATDLVINNSDGDTTSIGIVIRLNLEGIS